MSRILTLNDFPAPVVTKEHWTAIIPAAGRGSRLGYEQPKILFPVAGKPILFWLLGSLKDAASEIVLVLSPEGRLHVEPLLRDAELAHIKIVEQQIPRGMADAVMVSEPAVKTPYAFVLWGDQVTIRKATLNTCLHAHEARPSAKLTLPTIQRKKPYIHFRRDESQRITEVLEARETNIPEAVGESDCGLFCFTTAALFPMLRRAHEGNLGRGKQTQEFNLLPLIPLFDREDGDLLSIQIDDSSEALGINTLEDAALAAEIIAARSMGNSQ